MSSMDDVRRLASELPGVGENGTRFDVDGRGFVWTWQERVPPRKARVPNRDVLVVRVGSEADKRELIATNPDVFFTEPHYDGYPAVLVRLPRVGIDELRELVTDAWVTRASAARRRELGDVLDPGRRGGRDRGTNDGQGP